MHVARTLSNQKTTSEAVCDGHTGTCHSVTPKSLRDYRLTGLVMIMRRRPQQKQTWVRTSLSPSFSFFRSSHTSGSKLVFQWLPCQASGVVGPEMGLAGPEKVFCDWVRYKFDVQLLSQCSSTYNCLKRSTPEIL